MHWRVIIALAIGASLGGVLVMNTQKKRSHLVIGLAGDTMIGRLVNQIIQERGYEYPWGPNILQLLRSSNLNLVNLETTLTTATQPVPKTFNFKSDPHTIKSLQVANIGVVNLANNHILDFGYQGLHETIQTLDDANIAHVGAGANSAAAKQPVIFTHNGIKVGIIGYADYPEEWSAGLKKAGINYLKVGDVQTVKNDIKELRSQVDLLILSIHWGPNMRQYPTPEFISFAHRLIDSGIDIIHGHSAHIFQGMERYRNGLILYDTGDFIDDYAVDTKLRNDQGIFFQIEIHKSNSQITIQHIRLTPLLINQMRVEIATGDQAKEILKKMDQLSQLIH